MYKCSLDIAIYSDNDLICDVLNNVPPLKKFKHSIFRYQEIQETTIKNNDIIILDFPFKVQALHSLCSLKKEDSIIIVCANTEDLTLFSDNDYSIIDDIWIKPLNADLICFYFNRLQKQLKQTKTFELTKIELETLIQSIPFAILILDSNYCVLDANNKYLDLFLIEKSHVIGETLATLRGKYLDDNTWNLKDTTRGRYLYGNNKILKIKKEELINIFGDVTGYIYIYIDVTFEGNYENKLLKAANTDYLTQLNNRRGLNKFIAQHSCHNETTLMLIDLDNFKHINDHLGHYEGDRILVAFSNILLELFTSYNIFRLGGDEFLVALVDIADKNTIKRYAQAVIDEFKTKIISTTPRQKVSVSIGIAINTDEKLDFKELFKRADTALYQSKDLGKSQYSFWNDTDI